MAERTKPSDQYVALSKEQFESLLRLSRTSGASPYTQAFHLEQLAWLTIEILNQMVLARKFGFPSGDLGALDLLKSSETLSIEDHRRMKQILEYRNLSKPERAHFKIPHDALECDLVELERIMKSLALTK